MGARAGTRWYRVECKACAQEHGFSAGALVVLVEKAQDGDVSTIKGNSVCLLIPLADYVASSTEPRFDYVERVY